VPVVPVIGALDERLNVAIDGPHTGFKSGPGRRTAYKDSGMIHCDTQQPAIQVNSFI